MRAGSRSSNILICLYAGLAAAAVGKAIPLIGSIDADLGTSPSQSSWLISIVMAVGILVAPFAGRVGVRFGDKAMLAAGIVFEVIGSSVGATATSFVLLMLGRIIEGLAFFLIVNSAMTLLMKTNDGARRSGAAALFIACIPLGIGVSAALSAQIVALGWRSVFWSHAVIMAIALAGCVFFPKAVAGQDNAHAANGVLSAYRRMPPIWLGMVIAILSIVQLGSTALLPTYLTQTYALSIGTAAGISSIGQIIGISGNLLASILLSRGVRGSRIGLLSIALSIPAGVLVFVPALGLHANSASYLAVLLLCGCAGSALVTLAPTPMVTESPVALGQTNAVINQLNSLGLLVGPPLMFAVYANTAQFGPSLVAILCMIVPILILNLSGLLNSDASSPNGKATARR
ncbi:MFS transporter [Xanthomonas hyacinthi]|nr:hypothetical protein Y886_25785 [Xanthomonas hyacinthi DSM 19077]